MDPDALNYDPQAEREDGSCEYQGKGESAPDTYRFSDADLGNGRTRIELLDLLLQELGKGENGASIQLQDLYDIYRNNGIVGDPDLDLEGIVREQDSLYFDQLLHDAASRAGDPASVIGGRFVTLDSIDFVMTVRYGLMQSALYHHAIAELLEKLDGYEHVDPDASTATEREKVFDEAFSLFGVPRDYSRSTPFGSGNEYGKGGWFWGEACTRTDSALGQLPTIFDAFVVGRWALTEGKKEERDRSVRTVIREWERIAGASMVRHVKRCMKAIDKGRTGERIMHWSVCHGTLIALNAAPEGIIGDGKRQTLRDRLGATPNDTDTQALNEALVLLQDVYGFSNETLQDL